MIIQTLVYSIISWKRKRVFYLIASEGDKRISEFDVILKKVKKKV